MRITTWFFVILTLALALPLPAAEEAEEEQRLSSKTFNGLELRGIGPALMSGRIADIALVLPRVTQWPPC